MNSYTNFAKIFPNVVINAIFFNFAVLVEPLPRDLSLVQHAYRTTNIHVIFVTFAKFVQFVAERAQRELRIFRNCDNYELQKFAMFVKSEK